MPGLRQPAPPTILGKFGRDSSVSSRTNATNGDCAGPNGNFGDEFPVEGVYDSALLCPPKGNNIRRVLCPKSPYRRTHMPGSFKRLLSHWKYGKPVIIVSGLPRSGTSMMMKMLEAGGLEPVTDGIRAADKDNPKGYYELERVKTLDKPGDKSWVAEHKGKVIKVISFLLKDLPGNANYKVIFMRRNLKEVLVSQNKMLEHRGEENTVEDEKMHRNFEMHLRKVDYQLRNSANMEVLYVDYKSALENPHIEAKRVAEFLGGGISAERMAGVADPNLYRNRK